MTSNNESDAFRALDDYQLMLEADAWMTIEEQEMLEDW